MKPAGRTTAGHAIEAALWLLLAAFLYALSFRFEREIEIYKYGATAWPRAILLLIAIAAVGQFIYHRQTDTDDAPDAHTGGFDPRRFFSTCILLALPFIYMVLPRLLAAPFGDDAPLNAIKLGAAATLVLLYLWLLRTNAVGAMLALPILFGALMQDFGFYSLAPFFAAGVMFLMGERRVGWIVALSALIIGLLLLLFVSLLFVGLPTGNVSPFYEIGAGVVNLLQ